MIDKQQIEELKNILLNSKAVTFEPNVQKLYNPYRSDEFYVSNNDGHLTIDYFKFAEALYNAWYRKVDENAVVLTREEYDNMFSFKTTRGGFYNILDTVREVQSQETAKEILKWLVDTGVINTAPDTTKMYFKERFCVEVK